jgi:hypothetical protein
MFEEICSPSKEIPATIYLGCNCFVHHYTVASFHYKSCKPNKRTPMSRNAKKRRTKYCQCSQYIFDKIEGIDEEISKTPKEPQMEEEGETGKLCCS